MAVIHPHELGRRIDQLTVLDVRLLAEWEGGHIPGARHVPLDQLEDHLDELDRARLVVTVCRGGQRAAQATGLLLARGFDAKTLDGGMLAWAGHGLTLVNSDGGAGEVVEQEPASDEGNFDAQRFHDDLVTISLELKERFGEGVLSDVEIRAFFRDRLVAQGMLPEEAERLLDS
jgi:rhodanese-related sulfurtransferase